MFKILTKEILIGSKNSITVRKLYARQQSLITSKDTAILKWYFFNWDSLHARLKSHYEAWSYKKKKHKKITAYKKSVQKEPTVKRFMLILDLKPLRSQVKGNPCIGREFQSLAM